MNKTQQAGEKLMKAGQNMKKIGAVLTMVFTVPILLFVFFGYPGLIIGGILALFFITKRKR